MLFLRGLHDGRVYYGNHPGPGLPPDPELFLYWVRSKVRHTAFLPVPSRDLNRSFGTDGAMESAAFEFHFRAGRFESTKYLPSESLVRRTVPSQDQPDRPMHNSTGPNDPPCGFASQRGVMTRQPGWRATSGGPTTMPRGHGIKVQQTDGPTKQIGGGAISTEGKAPLNADELFKSTHKHPESGSLKHGTIGFGSVFLRGDIIEPKGH